MTARTDTNDRRLRLTPLAACLGLVLGCGTGAAGASAAPAVPGNSLVRVTGGADIPVSNCNDSGPGSLREAVGIAASGDQIRLEDLACSTISLTSGAIVISQYELGLFGPGMDALTIDGGATQGQSQRVLDHSGTGLLTLGGLTIANGAYVAKLPLAKGGCIRSEGSVAMSGVAVVHCSLIGGDGSQAFALGGGLGIDGSLLAKYSRIEDNVVFADGGARGGGAAVAGVAKAKYSTIRGNSAGSLIGLAIGGGLSIGPSSNGASSIYASTIEGNFASIAAGIGFSGNAGASAVISNSTISGNVASDRIGGVYSSMPLNINNSTVAFNRADSLSRNGVAFAVGVAVRNYPVDLQSTIIANNQTLTGYTVDISVHTGASITGTDNLITNSYAALPADTIIADPLLAPLAHNAGPRSTRTHDLLGGSPAVDAGNNSAGLDDDQRGMPRVAGAGVDIGALERQGRGVLPVTNCEDDGPGSLRASVEAAVSGDIIDASGLACSPITVTTGAIVVGQQDLIIAGGGGPNRPGRGDQATIRIHRSGTFDRVFRHDGTGTLEFWSLSIENGQYEGVTNPQGGCIRSEGEVRLWNTTVTSCSVQQYGVESDPSVGGAIYATSVIATGSSITDNIVESLNVAAAGGGIFVLDHFEITDSTIADNRAYSALENTSPQMSLGGGLFAMNGSGTDAGRIERSTISGNTAQLGGGLVLNTPAGSAAVISNSTISGNIAETVGGVLAFGSLTLQNSTVAFNQAENMSYAAGLHAQAPVVLQSSILANNLINHVVPYDFSAYTGVSVGGSNNLITGSHSTVPADTLIADPRLHPLADNGGRTLTHALQPDSPAIDAGNNLAGLSNDQRLLPRVVGPQADTGAFERQGPLDSDRIFANGFDRPVPDPQ